MLYFRSPSSRSSKFGLHNQILIGYPENATNDFDSGIDAKIFDDSQSCIFTKSDILKLIIQGRQFPFNEDDNVMLGFTAKQSGNYTIHLSEKEGIFNTHEIFIRDNLVNKITNLKLNDYSFESEIGTFENRFEIIYKNSETIINLDPAFFISSAENGFMIESNQQMSKIQIFDILGRNLFTKNINSTNEYIEFPKRGYVYIVIVDFQNGEKQNKKIIF